MYIHMLINPASFFKQSSKMIKKHKLSNIKNIWFYFHNPPVPFKNLNYDKELFLKLWEFIQSNLKNNNSYQPRKEVLNYITSRTMRRTLVPSDFTHKIATSKANSSIKNENSLASAKFQQYKKYSMYPISMKILKFHSKTTLLGNLVLKQFTKRETQEEFEQSWGGPEIFKLIVVLKDFEEEIKKYPELLVFFSAYWCGHCRKLRKPYGNAALMAKNANLPILFATFDITTDPDVALERGIVGIPLIMYFKQGVDVAIFRGQRTAEELFEFVKNPPEPENKTKKLDI